MTADRRVILLVGDSLGIGGLPDGPDPDADTLAHVALAADGLRMPTLGRWGLGNLTEIAGVPPVPDPAAVIARMTPTSAGTDSTSGHWELMGYRLEEPFPTYPDGFPPEVIEPYEAAIGREVLGNRPASGTVIIEELGGEHLSTGRPIVYTSADSVFQVAAHLEVVPLEQLYGWCETARELLRGPHAVGRVIARPFRGEPGSFERTSDRRDLSLPPPGETVLDRLVQADVPVVGIGKIEDLFAGRGLTASDHVGDNASAMDALERTLEHMEAGFVFVNLVDFDQVHGHRNDPDGYAAALESFDDRFAEVVPALWSGDRMIVTADHGTDPTLRRTTDHTREMVPMLAWGPDLPDGRDLGIRGSMADVGATVLDLFGLDAATLRPGRSFVQHL